MDAKCKCKVSKNKCQQGLKDLSMLFRNQLIQKQLLKVTKSLRGTSQEVRLLSMKRLFVEKGSSNRANKVLEVGLWVSYIVFWLKTKILMRECWVQKFYLRKNQRETKVRFFLNEKYNLWFQDCSMSGFPKGFRISKARLVNVFRKVFF